MKTRMRKFRHPESNETCVGWTAYGSTGESLDRLWWRGRLFFAPYNYPPTWNEDQIEAYEKFLHESRQD